MGRRNVRGLKLSFKPLRGGRGRGRWYKKFDGKAVYFGWGGGVSDHNSYQEALTVYGQWLDDARNRQGRPIALGLTRQLQSDFSAKGSDPIVINLPVVRERIAKLRELNGSSVGVFQRLADSEEKRRIITSLEKLTLDQIRVAASQLESSSSRCSGSAWTVA
jgi:hypothetical protein